MTLFLTFCDAIICMLGGPVSLMPLVLFDNMNCIEETQKAAFQRILKHCNPITSRGERAVQRQDPSHRTQSYPHETQQSLADCQSTGGKLLKVVEILIGLPDFLREIFASVLFWHLNMIKLSKICYLAGIPGCQKNFNLRSRQPIFFSLKK